MTPLLKFVPESWTYDKQSDLFRYMARSGYKSLGTIRAVRGYYAYFVPVGETNKSTSGE